MDMTDFAANFPNQTPPEVLVKLWAVYNDERFSVPDGLELYDFDGSSGLEAGWGDDPEMLGRLFAFAQANHSGSFYALWQAEEEQDVEAMPVILFGDEGGQLVVASNIQEWLRLQTANTAPYIEENYDNGTSFIAFEGEEDEDEDEQTVAAFQQWVEDNFGDAPITPEQAEKYAKQAQKKHQAAFDAWIGPFLP